MARVIEATRRGFRVLRVPLLFALIAAAVFPAAWKAAQRSNTREVEVPTPEFLPVVVFVGEEVELVWHGELEQYKQSHPGYSFRAPEGRSAELNKRLVAAYRRKVPGADAFPKFEARPVTSERQLLEVGLHGDGELVFWYEATDKEILPVRYMLTGPLFPFVPLFWSGLVGAVACGLCRGLRRLYSDAGRAGA